jgi:hypothetical protein
MEMKLALRNHIMLVNQFFLPSILVNRIDLPSFEPDNMQPGP